MSNDIINALKTADDVELPMDEAFYDKLHDKIMARVDDTEIRKLPSWTFFVARPKKYLKSHWKEWLGTGLSMIAVGYVGIQAATMASSVIPQSHTYKVVKNESDFLKGALGSPESFSHTLINHQSQDDFIAEVASGRLEISQEQFEQLKSRIN